VDASTGIPAMPAAVPSFLQHLFDLPYKTASSVGIRRPYDTLSTRSDHSKKVDELPNVLLMYAAFSPSGASLAEWSSSRQYTKTKTKAHAPSPTITASESDCPSEFELAPPVPSERNPPLPYVLSESLLEEHDRQLEKDDRRLSVQTFLPEASFASICAPTTLALVDNPGMVVGGFTHSGLLSAEARVRACEASNHLLNAFVKGRPELITSQLLAELPQGHETRLRRATGGFYEFGEHRFHAAVDTTTQAIALGAFGAACTVLGVVAAPILGGTMVAMHFASSSAASRDADERFLIRYGFPRACLLDHQATDVHFIALRDGDAPLTLILKVRYALNWTVEQCNRATASLLVRMLGLMSASGVGADTCFVALCEAIHSARTAIDADGHGQALQNRGDPQQLTASEHRWAAALLVLEQMVGAAARFGPLYRAASIGGGTARTAHERLQLQLHAVDCIVNRYGAR